MRKSKARGHEIAPDPVYNDVMVTTFVNNLMLDGKKNTAFKIFSTALEQVAKKTEEDGLGV